MVEINVIISQIKRKNELNGLADSFVNEILTNYLKKNKINLDNLREKEIKLIVKDVRSELRLYSGRFQKKKINLESELTEKSINSLLTSHSSTNERLNFYPELRNIIRDLKIKSILDIGCGLNPLALAEGYEYYALDIKEDEISIINSFFKANKINGKAFVYDISKIKNDLPETDLCLIFKVLDILEKKSHFLAEKIILLVKCKKILVSFSTKTLSGKPMLYKRRVWFENILKKNNLDFKTLDSQNEIFYLISKN